MLLGLFLILLGFCMYVLAIGKSISYSNGFNATLGFLGGAVVLCGIVLIALSG